MSGWIKLHRQSLDNPLFKKPDIWHYWVYCLLKANHEPNKIIWNKKEMVVDRGSFITGRKVAAIAIGLTERKVRTALNTLINLGMISINKQKSTSKFTYLTICNYSKYNDMLINGDQQATSKRPASDQQATTNKNVKKDKNEKNKNNKTIECFEEFISLYPKQIAKKEAETAWKQLFVPGYGSTRTVTKFIGPLTNDIFKILMDALNNQINVKEAQVKAGIFVSVWPNPATWLRGFRWNDKVNFTPPRSKRDQTRDKLTKALTKERLQ